MTRSNPAMAAETETRPVRLMSFEFVELPVGRQPLPEWLLGAKVRWNEGYANSPDLWLKADRCIREWEGQSFVREDRYLVARHPDGRSHRWGFAGEFAETDIARWRDGKRETVTMPATPPSEGCGGWGCECLMEDGPYAGRTVMIRGPWGCGPAAGYTEIHYTVRKPGAVCGAPSYVEGIGLAGLAINEDLFLRVVARFLPHLRVARISRPGWPWPEQLEVVDPAWDEPKTIRVNRPLTLPPSTAQAGGGR